MNWSQTLSHGPCSWILDFYPKSNGKPLEGFKQGSVIKLVFRKDHSSYSVEMNLGVLARGESVGTVRRLLC